MSSLDLSKYSKPGVTPRPATVKNDSGGSAVSRLLNTEISLFEKKFDAKQKEWFYSELGLLISAGVDIRTAFDIIELETSNKKHRALIAGIREDIVGGAVHCRGPGTAPPHF